MMILGIDEVGRGPWAGPLVVGAVVLGDAKIDDLTDSKKLTKNRRAQLDILIREKAAGYGLGWVSAEELDEIGLSNALTVATIRAVEQIKVPYHEIIIDGTVNFLKETSKGRYVTNLAKADLLIPAVSAASIIAKVARDTFMVEQDKVFPEYGFGKHVGYGTALHQQAIKQHGVTPLHRLSFKPLAEHKSVITTKQKGDNAENIVAKYLHAQGHDIQARNWRSRWCEIDIISTRKGTIYATEVKYRKTPRQGGGLAAITPKRAAHLKFAMEFYTAKHGLLDNDRKIQIVEVGGADYKIKNLVELD